MAWRPAAALAGVYAELMGAGAAGAAGGQKMLSEILVWPRSVASSPTVGLPQKKPGVGELGGGDESSGWAHHRLGALPLSVVGIGALQAYDARGVLGVGGKPAGAGVGEGLPVGVGLVIVGGLHGPPLAGGIEEVVAGISPGRVMKEGDAVLVGLVDEGGRARGLDVAGGVVGEALVVVRRSSTLQSHALYCLSPGNRQRICIRR